MAESEKPVSEPKPLSNRLRKRLLSLDPDDTIFILDANILFGLNKQRNEHATWLDIVKHFAELPRTQIIIPSVIADFEISGDVRTYKEGGKPSGVQTVDFALQKLNSAVLDLLSNASRGLLRKDGTIEMLSSERSNIIVLDCPDDQEFYESIQKLKARSAAGTFIEALNENIRRKDAGERSIDAAIKGLSLPNPIFIISNDINYLRQAPETSGGGGPVSLAPLGSFLHALVKYDGEELKWLYGADGAVTMHRFAQDLKEPGQRPLIHGVHTSGKDSNGTPGLDIYGFVRKVTKLRDNGEKA